MKLKQAVEIGKNIGLNDVRDCVDHICSHVLNYFDIKTQNIEHELIELLDEEKQYLKGDLEI